MRRIPEDRGVIFRNSTLVARIKKNRLEEIRIAILRNNKIDIRTYFFFQDEPEPKPTKKGIWLSFKQLPPIIDVFEKYKKDPSKDIYLEFDLANQEKLRVYVNEFKGSKVLHIRTFYLKDNELNPGKGISFSSELLDTMLASFKDLKKYNTDPGAR